MQIVNNIEERLEFVISRIIQKLKKPERMVTVAGDFDYDHTYSAEIIWRVSSKKDHI